MKTPTKISLITVLFCTLFASKIWAQQSSLSSYNELYIKTEVFTNNLINSEVFEHKTGYNKKDSTTIDTILINAKNKIIHIYFNAKFAYTPFRENYINELKTNYLNSIGAKYDGYSIEFYSNGFNVTSLIPNYYRLLDKNKDKTRMPASFNRKTAPWVQNISQPIADKLILQNINIAIWPSHGWYYESKLDRWEWQRARIFQTVEDLNTTSIILQYLLPMLENAGSQVILPRERSWQTNEVIVDNDQSTGNSIYIESVAKYNTLTGFRWQQTLSGNVNPFQMGTCIEFQPQKGSNEFIEWIPDIPENGEYPVYISYTNNTQYSDAVPYTVYHMGGKTSFVINQQMGGQTWVYLGTFLFAKGVNRASGKVIIEPVPQKKNKKISADAVRFGGGMGNVERNSKTSGRPRYQEAARYYLQYAGMPDTLVWHLNNGKNDDYADDYQGRGEWVNYLASSMLTRQNGKAVKGLNVPVDLSFALHTDAGTAKADSVIGTLGIYSTTKGNKEYQNGVSKLASRDLTDIIQTQIVEDLRQKYDTLWIRRGMWDKPYSEAARPNIPAVLIELFSHQNFMDARFGHEPQFKFDVSRAIYKGMVKFLSSYYGIDYIIQPLPISHFTITPSEHASFQLSWSPVYDSLESLAIPTGYIVYTKKNNEGFNNGEFTPDPWFTIKADTGTNYSFKVTAINKGGESFPSEVLSAGIAANSLGTALIVNTFDRLAGPAIVNEPNFAGILNQIDEGVAYHQNIHTTGSQFNFNPNSPWLDDDSPGFGASGAELENKITVGNTFDYTYIHGQSILNAGYSFVSSSDEAFEQINLASQNYFFVDLLAGEEKTHYMPKKDTVSYFKIFNTNMIMALKNYLNKGGNLFISGAYIGTDVNNNKQDSIIGNLLKYKWRTNNASTIGYTYFTDTLFALQLKNLQFNTAHNSKIYRVEAPDAIEPFDNTASVMLRYEQNNMSAGVLFSGKYKVVSVGFPFETINTDVQRNIFMQQLILFFNTEHLKN